MAATAGYLAPHDGHFFPNFAYYWLPAGAVVVAGVALGITPIVAAGGGIALALFLLAFHAWAASLGTQGAMAWVGYVSAMPGAWMGLLAAGWLAKRGGPSLLACLLIAVAATAVGLALNMGLICGTVMHCSS